ncbi:hypothetical protein Tsubulata_014913 [Turnera subulata]|uniref:FAF domain-containing protein n=1 Tax=Turnera subulata TaxID=218843 RepID=A0A9Q0FWC0_9ROSI|nr:hypothetical protein Tsubulata_014913 [Turnera subulata]
MEANSRFLHKKGNPKSDSSSSGGEEGSSKKKDKNHKGKAKESLTMSTFPPPIPCLKLFQEGKPYVYLNYGNEDGNDNSFTVEEIRIPRKMFHASREGGRLKLYFAGTSRNAVAGSTHEKEKEEEGEEEGEEEEGSQLSDFDL